jgi:hypothetical protein
MWLVSSKQQPLLNNLHLEPQFKSNKKIPPSGGFFIRKSQNYFKKTFDKSSGFYKMPLP